MVKCPGRNPCWSEAGIKCVLTVVSMRASITFAAGQSSEIDRYEVLREESLPGLGIGMTIDDFQIQYDWVPRFFMLKILSLSGPKALDCYSYLFL